MQYGDAVMKSSSIARRVSRCLAGIALAASVSFASREARAEFPTLDTAIRLAREHALVVHEAEGELGVANAQMTAAKVSSLGNPYTEIQVDRPWTNGQGPAGETVGRQIQAMSFNY